MLYLEFIEIMSSCTSILGREKCSRFDIEKLIFAPQDDKGAYSFKYKGSKSNEVRVYLPVSQAIRLISVKQKDEKLPPIYFLPSNWKIALSHSDNYPRLWQNVESYINKNTENIREINYEGLAGKLRSTEEVALFINKYLKNIPLDDKSFCMIGIFIGIQIIANEKVVEAPSDRLIKILTEKILACKEKTELTHRSELAESSGTMSFVSDIHLSSSIVFPDINFVGRKSELDLLHQKLSAVPNKVFLRGIGGIGKSEIAKMYAKLHSKEYNTILWITFEKNLLSTFVSDNSLPIQGMNRSNYPNDDDETYFSRKLRCLKEIADDKVLLIIDNFDVTYDEKLETVCSGQYTLIFTTRNKRISQTIPEIEIDEIKNDQELIELFKIEYKRNVTDDDIQAIRNIIEYFDKHTLSIRLIAGAMSTQRIKPQSMVEILNKNRPITKKEQHTTDSVFEKIKQVFTISKLSNDEKNILMNLSLVPMCGILVEYLYELCEFDDYEIIEGLIDRSWIIHNVGNDEVSLHPIITELASELLDETPDNCNLFISNLHKHCQYSAINVKYEDRNRNLKLSESIYNRMKNSNPMYNTAVYSYGYCILDSTQYYKAAEIFKNLIDTASDIVFKMNCCEKTAQCYVLCGEAALARDVVLPIWEQVKDIEVSNMTLEFGRYYTGLLHRLVESYRGLGDYNKSIFYGNLCADRCKNFYEIYSGDSAGWTKYHLGRTFAMQGDIFNAEKMLCEAVNTFKSNNDLNALGCTYSVLSLVFGKKEAFPTALKYNSDAQELMEPLLGNNHIDIAHNQKWLGDIFLKMKKFDDAEKCYQNAISIYKNKNCRIYVEEVISILNYINQMKDLE